MTQIYKADKSGNIIDEQGKIILSVVAKNCSYKYRQKAAKLLANALFNDECGNQKKEVITLKRIKSIFVSVTQLVHGWYLDVLMALVVRHVRKVKPIKENYTIDQVMRWHQIMAFSLSHIAQPGTEPERIYNMCLCTIGHINALKKQLDIHNHIYDESQALKMANGGDISRDDKTDTIKTEICPGFNNRH